MGGLTGCFPYVILQLGDFGLGFGLYFSTVRAIRNILLIAGFISAFNIYFFASSAYDNSENVDLDYLLRYVNRDRL